MPSLSGLKKIAGTVLEDAGSALSAVTPGAVKDKIFGTTTAPATPTTPEQTQSLIDAYIGHQPGDDQIVKNLKLLGATSLSVPVLSAAAELPGMPYDPHTEAQQATNSNLQPPDPLNLANPQLQAYFKAEPRAQDLYVRDWMPTDPDVINWAVQANMKKSPGMLQSAVSKFVDIAGRPIGGTLDMLRRPAQDVEMWYGSHFIFNDISDASLRQAMSRQAYGYSLNVVSDPHFTQLRKAQAEAQHIETDLGLRGPAAAAEYERWLKEDGGNPGLAAHITDTVAQMIYDPLWLMPMGIFTDAAKSASKGVTGSEDLGRIFRLANAPNLMGDYTIRDILRMPETQYRTALITHPSSLGPLRWLNERMPARLGDAAYDASLRYLSGPLSRALVTDSTGAVDAAATLDAKVKVLAHFSDSIRSGKVSDEAARLFGTEMLEDPALASLSAHTNVSMPKLIAGAKTKNQAGMYIQDVAEGIIDGLNKSPEIAQLAGEAPQELDALLLHHVSGNARAIAADGQALAFPRWFRNGWMRVVNKQKQVMSYFAIDRPELLNAVTANNLLTYYWTVSRQPFDATEIFAHTLGAEMRAGEQGLAPEFARLAESAGLEPGAAYRIAASQTYTHEAGALSMRAVDRQYRLDAITDVEDAANKARSAMTQPVKDLAPRGFQRYVKWPLTQASRVDRATRVSSFWASLAEQENLALQPGRLVGGLFPDLRGTLTETGMSLPDAERAEGFMLDHIRSWVRGGGSIADSEGLSKAWAEGVSKLRESDPQQIVSSYDYLQRFLRNVGYSDEAIPFLSKDYDPAMERAYNIIKNVDNVPMEQTQAQLEQLKHSYWKVDQAFAHSMHTDPILRPKTTYSAGLARAYGHDISQMEEVFRADMQDTVLHVDRYMSTVFPDWEGAHVVRRDVISAADDMMHGRLSRLSEIAKNSLGQLADPTMEWDRDAAWIDYWKFTEDSTKQYYDTAREALGRVNENSVAPLDEWYKAQESARAQHRSFTAAAMRRNTEDGWDKAAEKVAGLYKQLANDRAAIFGVDVNDPAKVIGEVRHSAPPIRMIEEYLTYIQDNLGADMAAAREAGKAAEPVLKNPYDALVALGDEVSKRGPTVAQRMVGNAMFKTDLVRMNYDKQYGWDGILQMFAPYEVFSTRTAMNWLIRGWQQPGALSLLAKAIMLPSEYAQQYGYNVAPGSLPIPIPGLSAALRHLPFVGNQLKNANFGNLYWVDPLAMAFPMTRFFDSYDNEARTATPAGQLANWMQTNTPLGLSPFAKIIGGVSGILPRDAWTNDLFSGGPFGVPPSIWGRAASRWLHTGDPTGMPEGEMNNYSNHGTFSWQFLGNVLGISNKNQFDEYKQEKAVASNLAESLAAPGITPDQRDELVNAAYLSLKTHAGPTWDAAGKTASSLQFLTDVTGWLGFRSQGSTKGDNILLGQKILYSKAAASGDLTTFFEKFPGYDVKRAVSKGLTNKQDEQQLIDTQMYYSDIERLVKQPYKQSLDELGMRIDAIRAHPNVTQTDMQQIKLYQNEVNSIREQQDKIVTLIKNAYPNAQTTPSLYTLPQERALLQVANRWYDIQLQPGEAYADYQARQQAFLNQFPAHTDKTDTTWTSLTQSFMLSSMQYNVAINLAAQKGDWNKVDNLTTQREKALNQLHAAAENNVSRQDVEQYLSSTARDKSPGELEFDQAQTLYNLWMSYVGSDSPLSSSQKYAVSAYFRSLPLLQKHYNAATIDLSQLSGDGQVALARRDVLIKQYNALSTNDAKVDFMKQHEQEINYANQVLGLPPMSIIDFRPPAPDVSAIDPYLAAMDFSGDKNLADYLYGGYEPPNRGLVQQAAADSPTGSAMPTIDIQSFIDASTGRGY